MKRIRLTAPQVSALECRGIHEAGLVGAGEDDSPRLRAAWSFGAAHLEMPEGETAALELLDEIIDHCNGEDAQAEMQPGTEGGRWARRAATSLSAISGKVCKAIIGARK